MGFLLCPARTGSPDHTLSHAAVSAMLRLQSFIAARLLSSTSVALISPLHRLLYEAAASPAVSQNPSFAVEPYLVETCGLTRAQALKSSAKISHLKSPSKPDAVLAFLAELGLSSAAVAAAVAKDPKLLCASVDRTLTPNVQGFKALGLSRSEIARLVSVAPVNIRLASAVSNLPYYLHLFGSYEKLIRALKFGTDLLRRNLEKVVKPNVAFLQECGIDATGIASLCLAVPRLLGTKPEHVRAMAVLTEAVGVPRGSGMFRLALQAVAFRSKKTIAVKVEHLMNTFRWSDDEVRTVVCRFPMVLTMSKDMIQSKSEFLISEVGLEPAYIARRPVILGFSLKDRLRPRYYAVKFLKENGLLDHDRDYYYAVRVTEKVFMEKCMSPHNEASPYLSQDYATTCRGEVPPRFIFA